MVGATALALPNQAVIARSATVTLVGLTNFKAELEEDLLTIPGVSVTLKTGVMTPSFCVMTPFLRGHGDSR